MCPIWEGLWPQLLVRHCSTCSVGGYRQLRVGFLQAIIQQGYEILHHPIYQQV